MRGWERLLRAGRPAPFFFARRFVLCLTLCCAAGLCLGRTSGYAPWLWLFPVSLLAAAFMLLSYRYIISETRASVGPNAGYIANFTAANYLDVSRGFYSGFSFYLTRL